MELSRLLLIVLICLPTLVQAALYRYVDEQGNVVYTDRPVAGAQPVSPGTITVIPSTPRGKIEVEITPSTPPRSHSKSQPSREEYRLRILSPRPDEGVRANDGRITVSVVLEPRPKAGRALRYQAYLDGKPYGPASTRPQWVLEEVTRGSHTLAVALLDDKGQELARTPSITFHVLRVSRLIRPH